MPTITVLAPDSALAMDEVVRQLGGDAYILSTSQQDGMVQIKATNDPGTSTPKRPSIIKTIFEDEMEKQLAAGARGRVSVAIDDNIDGGSPAPIVPSTPERPQLVAVNGARMTEASARTGQPVPTARQTSILADAATPAANPSADTSAPRRLEPSEMVNPFEDRLKRLEAALGLAHEGLAMAPGQGVAPMDGPSVRAPMDFPAIEDNEPSEPTAPPPYDGAELVAAGIDAAQVQRALADLKTPDQAGLIAALARRMVSSTPVNALDADAIVVVGPSGGGKTTLAAKFAALLSETREDRALTLINLSDETQPEGGLLRCYGQMMNVPVQRWDVAGPDDWTAPRGGATQIIDMACTGEEFQDLWPTLRQHFSGRRVHVVLAMPSGAAAARISSELALYQPQSPEVVLTKLDECECSLPEMSQFLVGGARVGWLSGTRNLLENLAQATTDILEQYLQYSLQLTAQPHSTKAAQ